MSACNLALHLLTYHHSRSARPLQPHLRRRRCCRSFGTTSIWTRPRSRQPASLPWPAPSVSGQGGLSRRLGVWDMQATRRCPPPSALIALPHCFNCSYPAAVARVAMGGVCDRWGPRYGAASLNLLTAAASFGERSGFGCVRCCLVPAAYQPPACWPAACRLPLTCLQAGESLLCSCCLHHDCHVAMPLVPSPSLTNTGMAAVENSAGYLAARLFIGFSLASFVACQFWCSVMFSPR